VRRETKNEGRFIVTDGFQSTPFVRRETKKSVLLIHSSYISIHSLREKGDILLDTGFSIAIHFNPLPS